MLYSRHDVIIDAAAATLAYCHCFTLITIIYAAAAFLLTPRARRYAIVTRHDAALIRCRGKMPRAQHAMMLSPLLRRC